MGRLFLINLEGDFYSCKHCRTHFALEDDVISRVFNLFLPVFFPSMKHYFLFLGTRFYNLFSEILIVDFVGEVLGVQRALL